MPPPTKKDFPKLKNAPLVEARIEIRVKSNFSPEIIKIKELRKKIPKVYSITPQNELAIEIRSKPKQTKFTDGLKGFRLESKDKCRIFLFNKNNFAFSRLHPYIDWQNFINEALKLWKIYLTLAAPIEEINRLGVRFINKIKLPEGIKSFNDYSKFPKEPNILNFPLIGFFAQNTIIIPDTPYAINITETIPKSLPHNDMSLIFDIDVYTRADEKLSKNNGTLLKESLGEMRQLKNQIFFNYFTETALEKFK